MPEHANRLAREAFKTMLGGIAGGAALSIMNTYGFLISTIAIMLIFGIVIVSFSVAEFLYGRPVKESKSEREQSPQKGPAS